MYYLRCPKHKNQILRCEDSAGYKDPNYGFRNHYFYCEKCGIYYAPSPYPEDEGKTIGELYRHPLIYTASEFWNDRVDVKRKKDKHMNEKEIRIKPPNTREEEKLKADLNAMRIACPSLIPASMSAAGLIRKIFPEKVPQECIIRNLSVQKQGSKDLLQKVELMNRNSSYIRQRVSSNPTFVLTGRLRAGELVVDHMRLVENPKITDDDIRENLTVFYNGPNHQNYLSSIITGPNPSCQKTRQELKDWYSYLDWKKELAERRIQGFKYINFHISWEQKTVTFLTCYSAEQTDQFNRFRNSVIRNEVGIYSQFYSSERFQFRFNRDNASQEEGGMTLDFSGFGARYFPDQLMKTDWMEEETGAREYTMDTGRRMGMEDKLRRIRNTLQNPAFLEISYYLDDRAQRLVQREIRRNGEVSPETAKKIAGQFYKDGFLATSQIGDFALIGRMKHAMDELALGNSASDSLQHWLFRIQEARRPRMKTEIQGYQNPHLNESQKEAVQKILDVPDVCLIQGPPGTGKTTVIAEAVYQYVIRGKRVLITSQANLAVDNALARLKKNPSVRAIRLGDPKKIDDSVSDITEDQVLKSFYQSLEEYVRTQYLNPWRESDQKVETLTAARQEYQTCMEILAGRQKQLDRIAQRTEEGSIIWRHLLEESEKQEKNRKQLERMESVLSEKTDLLDSDLDAEELREMFMSLSDPLQKINQAGFCLLPVGTDLKHGTEIDQKQANLLLCTLINNLNQLEQLQSRIQNGKQGTQETRELEKKKMELQIVNEKMKQGDRSVLDSWIDLTRQIEELEKQSSQLSQIQKKLFQENLYEMDSDTAWQRASEILKAGSQPLAELRPFLTRLIQMHLKRCDRHLRELQDQIENRDRRIAGMAVQKQELSDSIAGARQRIDEISTQFHATSESFPEKIRNAQEAAQQISLKKGTKQEWQGILEDLCQWIDDIPDYAQEKDIFKDSFINGCNVVGVSCTENSRTLTDKGFSNFDLVIIDEVSKATPPEMLIPMIKGKKVVLVGDHRQLPPLFNEHEKSYEETAQQETSSDVQLTMEEFHKYKGMVTASMFEDYFRNAPVSIRQTLDTQYRMHSDIMDLINFFYNGQLKDGYEDEYTNETKAHHLTITGSLGASLIVPDLHAYWIDSSRVDGYDIYEQRKSGSSSAENRVEAEVILELLKRMDLEYASQNRSEPVSVGVISFYFDQVILIRSLLKNQRFRSISVEVNTVDRFQGKEKEIILVSLVRNVPKHRHSLDSHIASFQRMNVAFSRAQNLLVIIGAVNMYAPQEVRISDMNTAGKEEVLPVYRNIIELLDRRGARFDADDILSEEAREVILRETLKWNGVRR